MSVSSRPLTRGLLVGVLLISTAYGAAALTVKTETVEIDGAFLIALVVEYEGRTYIHRPGEDGLTYRIMQNPKRALEWAANIYNADFVPTEIAESDADGGENDDDGRDGGIGTS